MKETNFVFDEASRADMVTRLKGLCERQEQQLRKTHFRSAGREGNVSKRAGIADEIVQQLFCELSQGRATSLAVIAYGGYGRSELSPLSDLDILCIHLGDHLSEAEEEFVRLFFTALWDIGYKVGHATRSCAEAIAHANSDLTAKTGLLEGRFLVGNRSLANVFFKRFRRECIVGQEEYYFDWRAADQLAMHTKHGNSVFVQEPDIKCGVGGLRDFQNLLWHSSVKWGEAATQCRYYSEMHSATSVATPLCRRSAVKNLPSSSLPHISDQLPSLQKLVAKKILTNEEAAALAQSHSFLLGVRTALQYAGGRDILSLQLQGSVAEHYHSQRDILRRIEAFMRDYYKHTRTIHALTDTALLRLLKKSHLFRTDSQGRSSLPFTAHADGTYLSRDSVVGTSVPASPRLLGLKNVRSPLLFFSIKGTAVDKFLPSTNDLIERHNVPNGQECPFSVKSPDCLMRVFFHAQKHGLALGVDVCDAIRAHLYLADSQFRRDSEIRQIFLEILSRKGEVGRILRLMHEMGFLGLYIPEFGKLDCLVQHEFYHRYTADEHTLLCLESLDAVLFADTPVLRPYREIFRSLENPSVLYLAALLHDIGKANNGIGHENAGAFLARRVARRLGLSPQHTELLALLVALHGAMSFTASKRNLDDEATIAHFAAQVKSRSALDALLLLTLADGLATGADHWSDWKESLVWTLYHRTKDYLAHGTAFAPHDEKELAARVAKKLPANFSADIAQHFSGMDERYFRVFDDKTIAEHIRIFRVAGEAPVFRWFSHPAQGNIEVWVAMSDRMRLLERLAGAFLVGHLNILNADIFTRKDGLVLDVFRVQMRNGETAISEKKCRQIEHLFLESLAHETFDFSVQVKKDTHLRRYRISQDVALPTKVTLHNEHHPTHTLIDIETPDRIGLLYDILHSLGKEQLRIDHARIATEKGVAMDSFYVTTLDGKKIPEDSMLPKRIL